MDEVRNVIIVGSGPAGYTAAIYTARANLRPLVIEGVAWGGALINTTAVENFPGFPTGIMGPELMDHMREQAARFGAEMIADDASRVELTGEIKTVWVGQESYRARTVILATGSKARPLDVPGEREMTGHGVSTCATCDGAFFRKHHVAVVGGGDSAMEDALHLTKFADSVTIVHRRDELRASKIMAERALHHPKIRFEWNTVVIEVFQAGGTVRGVRLCDAHSEAERTLDVTGVFVAIGHEPVSELFTGQLELDASGYVVVQSPSTRTSATGVFAAGDLVDHHYRQAISAAGTGCAAALDAERYLTAHGVTDSMTSSDETGRTE